MASKTPAEALAKRVLTDAAIVAKLGNRFTPSMPDQEPEYYYGVYRRVGGGDGTLIDGPRGLKAYLYRIEVFGKLSEECDAILLAIIDRLCGNPRKGLAVWRDIADGVQGCFPAEDQDADTLDDGGRVNGQTVTLWFNPQ
jgi:hypothetical protein